MKVVWTEQAYARLAEIYDFVGADSPEAAERLIDKLEARANSLERFPESGRRIPELSGSELRELIEGNYRIVYRNRKDRVEVVTVFEGHQLFPIADLATEDQLS